MFNRPTDEKQELRDKIQKDTEAYLKKGKKIYKAAINESALNDTPEIHSKISDLLLKGNSTTSISKSLHVGTNLVGRIKGNLVSSGKLSK